MSNRRFRGEGSIWKEDGGYRGSISINGTRVRVRGATATEVRLKLEEAREKGERGVRINKSITVSTALTMWLDEYVDKRLRATTRANYRYYVEFFLRPHLGSVRLADLNTFLVDRFIAAAGETLTKSGSRVSPTTVRHATTVLSTFCNQMVDWAYLTENPVLRAKRPTPVKHRAEVWTPRELQRFFSALAGNFYEPHLKFIATTGVRLSEMRGLRWKDIDLDERLVTINHNLVRDEQAKKWTENPPKSESGHRHIPLVEPAYSALVTWRKMQWIEIVNSPRRGFKADIDMHWINDGYVFLSRNGRPMTSNMMNSALRRVCYNAGIAPIKIHELRHSFATTLLAMNAPDKTVQNLLGHSTIAITKDIYGHVLDQHRETVMDAFSEKLMGSD